MCVNVCQMTNCTARMEIWGRKNAEKGLRNCPQFSLKEGIG